VDWRRVPQASAPADAVNGDEHASMKPAGVFPRSRDSGSAVENGPDVAPENATENVRARKLGGSGSYVTSANHGSDEARCQRIAEAVTVIMQELGVDPVRSNLRDTPERYARALLEFTSGYALSPEETLSDAVFSETYSDMILERDIDIWSLCEHHMVPFFWKMSHSIHSTGTNSGSEQARQSRGNVCASFAGAGASHSTDSGLH
jgi:hypothetical protein